MNTQPEALRLADGLENIFIANEWTLRAAAELRRLHEIEKLFLAYKLEQEAAKEQA